MTPRICICCGEPMSEKNTAFSRNPNICACCSSLADGMIDTEVPASRQTASGTGVQALLFPPGLVAPAPRLPGSAGAHN